MAQLRNKLFRNWVWKKISRLQNHIISGESPFQNHKSWKPIFSGLGKETHRLESMAQRSRRRINCETSCFTIGPEFDHLVALGWDFQVASGL